MAHKGAFEALNRTHQDIRDSSKPIDGVTLLLPGDFSQTLLVIAKCTRVDAVRACLKSSVIWSRVKTLNVSTSMRAHLNGDTGSAEFPLALLALAEGKIPSDAEGFVKIDELATIADSPTDLMNAIFSNLSVNFADSDWLSGRAILAPKYCTVDDIYSPSSGTVMFTSPSTERPILLIWQTTRWKF